MTERSDAAEERKAALTKIAGNMVIIDGAIALFTLVLPLVLMGVDAYIRAMPLILIPFFLCLAISSGYFCYCFIRQGLVANRASDFKLKPVQLLPPTEEGKTAFVKFAKMLMIIDIAFILVTLVIPRILMSFDAYSKVMRQIAVPLVFIFILINWYFFRKMNNGFFVWGIRKKTIEKKS